jgi:2-phosphosulfolactate phosphatase
MKIDVYLLPKDLPPSLEGKTAIVFDVLRATTSIAAALSVGVRSIRAFADLESAKAAANATNPRPVLCGEVQALAAPGFDLGNSPRQFTAEHRGRDVFLSTTNGTVALAAARSASQLFAAALVNVGVTARDISTDVVLVCSGTNGEISLEDTIGAGAMAEALIQRGFSLNSDTARIAHRLFLSVRDNLPATLRDSQGGRNIMRVRLDPDIDFAARLDVLDVVARVDPKTLVITKVESGNAN